VHYAESLHWFLKGRIMEGVSDYWSFFYPLLAVPLGWIYGSAEPALRLLSIIAGTALIVPAMSIAGRLWGRRAALFAGVLIALHPNLIEYSTAAMTEPLYSLLLVSATALMLRFMELGDMRSLVALGVVLGLSYTTRQEAQLIAAIVIFIILLGRGGGGLGAPFKRRILNASLVLVLFLGVITPYMMLVHRKTGKWTGTKASVNLSSKLVWDEGMSRERYVYGLNDEGTQRRIVETGRKSAAAILWSRRGEVASGYFTNLNRGVVLFPILLSSPFMLLLVPLGIFGRRWKVSGRGSEMFLLVMGAFPLVLYSIFRVEFRYLVPLLPVYLMWGAVGCTVITDWFAGNISRRPVFGLALLLVVFLSLVPFTIRRHSAVSATQKVKYREIGTWMKDNGIGDDRLLAHSGCPVSYYAGNPEATFIPWTDLDGLLDFARRAGYGYLLVDEAYFIDYRPQLAAGVVGASSIEGLTKVNTFTSRSGGRIVLFRVDRGSR